MSDTRTPNTPKGNERNRHHPRAVVHKRILSVAESRPGASMEEIADDVTGATTSLVEQVLSEYGDPAGDDPASGTDTAAAADTDSGSTTDANETSDDEAMSGDSTEFDGLTEVTEKQRETLREIRERPDATQAELAERLGVTSATISQRVNGIDGFDWSDRQAFVELFFEKVETDADDSTPGDSSADHDPKGVADGRRSEPDPADPALGDGGNTDVDAAFETAEPSAGNALPSEKRDDDASDGTDREDRDATPPTRASASGRSDTDLAECLGTLTARIESLEQRMGTSRSVDPDLARKVLRACFESEQISADEEVQVVERILEADTRANVSLDSSDR